MTATDKEDPLKALDRVLKAPTRHQIRQKAEYTERLSSFATATYFAKPASLSPLVCAAFGWSNADVDILQCQKCQAIVSVSYMAGLSTFASDKLTCRYEQQLGSAHDESCVFRKEAEAYFAEKEERKESSILPSVFFKYFPMELVELVEARRPIATFGAQVKQRLNNERVATMCESVQFHHHASVMAYRPPISTDNDESVAIEESLFQTIKTAQCDFGNAAETSIKVASLLTLFGWYPDVDKANTSMSCQLCGVALDNLLPPGAEKAPEASSSSSSPSTSEPPTKRTRVASTVDLLSSHRHYCPYVCGFPRQGASCGVPLWKALADKLLAVPKITASDIDAEPSDDLCNKSEWVKVNALLNAGLARPRRLRDLPPSTNAIE